MSLRRLHFLHHHGFSTVDQLYPRTTSTIFWGSASGVRAPRDGPSPERNSRRRGGLPIPPRVPCLPALPPPLTACPMLDSLDIGFCVLGAGLAGHRVCFISGYMPPPGWPPDRSAIVDSSARLGLARDRARHAPPLGRSRGECAASLRQQAGPAVPSRQRAHHGGCRTRVQAQASADEATSRSSPRAPA